MKIVTQQTFENLIYMLSFKRQRGCLAQVLSLGRLRTRAVYAFRFLILKPLNFHLIEQSMLWAIACASQKPFNVKALLLTITWESNCSNIF